MEKIILKYNYKKIIGSTFLCIIFLALFVYGILYSKNISSIEPSNTSVRYRGYAQLFYENEKVVIAFSLLLGSFFLVVFYKLIKKIFKKEFIIIKENNGICLGDNYIGNINNIQLISVVKHNYNSWVYIYLNDTSVILNSKKTTFQKLYYLVYFYFNKNKLAINVSLFEGESTVNLEKIQKILQKRKYKRR